MYFLRETRCQAFYSKEYQSRSIFVPSELAINWEMINKLDFMHFKGSVPISQTTGNATYVSCSLPLFSVLSFHIQYTMFFLEHLILLMFHEKLECRLNRELDLRQLQMQLLMYLKGSYNSLKSYKKTAGLHCTDFVV